MSIKIKKLIRKEIILTITSLIVMIAFFGYITYAYFLDVEETDMNVISYGDISLAFCADSECGSTISNIGRIIGTDENGDPLPMYPQSKTEALDNVPYIFKVTNSGAYPLTISIRLSKKLNPTLHSSYTDYTEIDDSYIYTAINEVGQAPGIKLFSEIDNEVIHTFYLNPEEYKIFNLWTWIREEVPNSIDNSYFIAEISLRGEYIIPWYKNCKNSNKLGCKMISDNEVKTNPDLTTSAKLANEYGVYKAEANSIDIYYYRGGDHCENSNGIIQSQTTENECTNAGYVWKTLNNNIIFNNMCWQIIRTNENGSVRVLYNGVPTNNQCTATGADTAIGYGAYNASTHTINDKTYFTYTDTSAVGYTFGSPVGKGFIAYKTTSPRSAAQAIPYGVLISTDYTINEDTGIVSLSGQTKTVSSDTAPDSTYKYTCLRTNNSCATYIHEITDQSVITNDSANETYSVTYTNKIGSKWSTSEADATASEVDSTIKTAIENWYASNLLETVNDKISDSGFCNDRTLITNYLGYGSSAYYNSYTRTINSTPTYECINSNRDLYTVSENNGNGNSTYPVGLLTTDELLFAGIKRLTNTNTNSYLYNGSNYWGMTPVHYSSTALLPYVTAVDSNGAFSWHYVHSNSSNHFHYRPVISLIRDITVQSGIGSKTNPYIVN